MPYIPPTHHFERVSRLIAGRVTDAGAEHARLASSHLRALHDYHLDPGASTGPRILSAAELRIIQRGEQALLGASGLCLPRLHEMVREAGYCVLLANADGVTIDYCVDHDHRNDFKRAGLYLGSCWSEQEEGTCGIAAALSDQSAITVHKTDHFRAAFTGLTCSAAPIFSSNDELIGVLNASALYSPDERDSQRLVNRLVRQNAVLIEDAYFLKTHTHCWVVLGHRNRHYVEVQPEILIAIDGHGQVLAANRCARQCIPELSVLPGAAPRHIDALFDLRAERLFATHAGQALLALRPVGGGALLHARVRAPLKCASSRPAARRAAPADIVLDAQPDATEGFDLLEREHIKQALTQTQWRAALAAPLLGMSRATLYRRIARFKIVAPHRL
ncbi:MAG: sigma-54-dependent Fis family transcriptional regulator [Glaciimonas sp.]|nr:sigma-54-dependent Fis family transcriptional regulator [Glaciimonas sp.]